MKDLMEFEITPTRGMEIIGPFEGAENLMSGFARKVEIRFDEAEAEAEFLKESKERRV